MKKLILLLFIVPLLLVSASLQNSHKAVIARLASGGTPVTVYIGTTTCGGQACDYGTVDSAYISPGSGDFNGRAQTIVRIDGNEGQGFVYLDTSDIPAGKTITSAKLFVYVATVDSSPDVNITVHRLLTSPGGASSVDLTNMTYNQKVDDTNVQWGGDTQAAPLSGTDYDATAVFTQLTSGFTAAQFNEISDAALTTLVKNWYDGTWSEYGVFMLCAGDYSKIDFSSTFQSTANIRPYWEITYE